MKKHFFKYILPAFFLTISACNRDDVKPQNMMQGIQKLSAISIDGGVVLKWENPDDRKYDKVNIWYEENGEKIEKTVDINDRYSSFEISLSTMNVYKFFVQAFNSDNNAHSETESIKSRSISIADPDEELNGILNSISMYGGDGGAVITWDNPNDLAAKIEISYEDKNVVLSADSLVREISIGGLDYTRSYKFTVDIQYSNHFKTESKEFIVIPKMKVVKLENSGWEIQASSEELSIENAPATNLLDDNPHTWWRSRVSSPEESYPHWVIIDMKSIHEIYGVSFARKYGDSDNSSWDINLSFSKDGSTFTSPYVYVKNSPDSSPYLSHEFNRTVEGEQLYLLPDIQSARYVRVDMVRGGKPYAVYGDINVYGQ